MALFLDYTDRSAKFVEPDHVGKLEEFRARVIPVNSSPYDSLPTAPTLAKELERAKEAFEVFYAAEHAAASHLVAMLAAVKQREVEQEAAVRRALELGEDLPVSADVFLVNKVIDESRQARIANYSQVESLGQVYQAAAARASASRALLQAELLRPVVESFQPTIDALREADAAATSDIDRKKLVEEFRKEGLL